MVRSCSLATETCVCTAHGGICAAKVGSGCPSQFAADGRCLPLGDADYIQEIPTGQLCPKSPEPIACGGVDANGRLQRCADGTLCACTTDGKGSCASRVPASTCASGLLQTGPGFARCAPDTAKELAQGLCDRHQPAAVSCGVGAKGGHITPCRSDEQCACTFQEGALAAGSCVRPSTTCPSALEFVHDGACLELAEGLSTLALPASTAAPIARTTSCSASAQTSAASATDNGTMLALPSHEAASRSIGQLGA